jgi:hypothetical protein
VQVMATMQNVSDLVRAEFPFAFTANHRPVAGAIHACTDVKPAGMHFGIPRATCARQASIKTAQWLFCLGPAEVRSPGRVG